MEIAEPRRYGQIARGFHWLTAAFVVLAFVAGVTMQKMAPGADHDRVFDVHRSFGLTVLALVVLRLLWRLTHPAPPLPASIAPVQRFAAEVTHWVLYGLILVQPMIGWLGEDAFGGRISVYGLFEMPNLIGKDEALSKILFGAHQLVAYAILAFVTLHVAAACYHAARGDGIMRRMWW